MPDVHEIEAEPRTPRTQQLVKLHPSYHPAWVACCNAVRWDTLSHHTAGTNNAACADCHAFQYDAMSANPYIILNRYRSGFDILSVFIRLRKRVVTDTIVHLMTVRVNDKHTRTDVHVVANRQTVVYPHPCAAHPHVVTNRNPRFWSVRQYRALQVAANRVHCLTRGEIKVVTYSDFTPPMTEILPGIIQFRPNVTPLDFNILRFMYG